MKLLIATNNQGKLKEIKEVFKNLKAELVSLNEAISDFEVEETGKTFKENAVLKAKEYAKKSGLITIADDSGLEIDALNGKPGVYSARFLEGKPQKEKNQTILEMMRDTPEEEREARFKAVVAVATPDGRAETAEGILEGKIAREARGENGFGYDPIFIPEGLSKTNAELKTEEKNKISHRGRAFRKAIKILRNLIKK